jgi:hypothetical protein
MSGSRRSFWIGRFTIGAFALAVLFAQPAWSAQPRPWLCRQIPVFSDSAPMTWHATKRGTGRWLMIFMRYAPAGGHDGFTIVSTHNVNGEADGALAAGRWYAVAQYSAEGHWICPGNVNESSPAGSISNLCYGEDDGACDVKLVVKSASTSSSSLVP